MSAIYTKPSINLDDVVAIMPAPATVPPKAEATVPAVGTDPKIFSLDGHQHPRLTSTTYASIATGSTVAVSFTRSFTNKPGIVITEIEGDIAGSAQPANFKVQTWVQDAGSLYTGCVVKAWRAQTVPQNLVTLLVGAVYNLFAASVVGTQFSCIAVARSDVPS